jgi:hypothetical protein
MSKARDALASEILRTVPQPRIIAAATWMWRRHIEAIVEFFGGELDIDSSDKLKRNIGELTRDEVADYVETLDVRELKVLRTIALDLEKKHLEMN